MSEQGIDITKSGWENPEGFKPRERDHVPPAPPACEAEGPNGWVCDLAKGHPGNAHHADGGPTWPMIGTPPFGSVRPTETARMAMDMGPRDDSDPESGQRTGPWKSGDVVSSAGMTQVDMSGAQPQIVAIREVAREAIADPMPAQWALALGKIVEMTRGY